MKESIIGLGSNITPTAIQRISKCLGILQNTVNCFNTEVDVGKHSAAKQTQDVAAIVNLLHGERVFKIKDQDRKHKSFNFKNTVLTNIDSNKINAWLKRAVKHVLEFQ